MYSKGLRVGLQPYHNKGLLEGAQILVKPHHSQGFTRCKTPWAFTILLAITPFELMSFDSEVPNPSPAKQKKEKKKIGENIFFLKGDKRMRRFYYDLNLCSFEWELVKVFHYKRWRLLRQNAVPACVMHILLLLQWWSRSVFTNQYMMLWGICCRTNFFRVISWLEHQPAEILFF